MPTELRIEVLRAALVSPDPIELWPETGSFEHNAKIRKNFHRNFARRTKWALQDNRGLVVQLLRVSRAIHELGVKIFYGENEFRFSAVNGWIVANCFLYTIGPRHFQHLRVITLPSFTYGRPWTPAFNTPGVNIITDTPAIFTAANLSPGFQSFVKHLPKGLKLPDNFMRSNTAYPFSISDVCRVISKTPSIKMLNIIWRHSDITKHPHQAVTSYWRAIDDLQRDRPIQVSLVLLEGRDDLWYAQNVTPQLTPQRAAHREVRKQRLLRKAVFRQWAVKRATKTAKGKYQIGGVVATFGPTVDEVLPSIQDLFL